MGSIWRWTLTGVLAAAGLMASLFGLGQSYQGFLTPRSSAGQFYRIYGDGWLENGARISLPNIAERANYARLTFDPWRPPGTGAAMIRASVCGQVASQFEVRPDDPVATVYLTGSCEPRDLSFEVLNPFVPSSNDQRQLGARLQSVRVLSPLGVPLQRYDYIFAAWGAIFLLGLLSWVLASSLTRSNHIRVFATINAPLISFALLSSADSVQYPKLVALWIVCMCLGVGVRFSQKVVQQGWQEDIALSSRFIAVVLSAVVIIGVALRFYGLSFGLPGNYHPDEVPKVNAIMRMVQSGTLNPQYFLHPSFLLYTSYFTNTIFHALGLVEWLGVGSSFEATAYLAGRTVSAIAGSLSIIFIFFLGKRLLSPFAGLLAAAFLAVYPLHVTCSRYMKEDALLTCMILASLVALVKAAQENRRGLLYFAGFLAGVAASTKYSGLLAVAFIAAAPWIRSGRFIPDFSFFKPTAVALFFFPIGFVVCTPYSVLTVQHFVRQFNSERNHMLRGHTIPVDAWSQYWMYHFWRSIVPGIGFIGTLLACIGVGFLLWRRRLEDWFVVALLLFFYVPAEWVKAKPEPQPERYIFPCLPFLALAAGELLRAVYAARSRVVAGVVIIGALFIPGLRTVQLASELHYDTRDQMADWMRNSLEPGAKVLLDWKPYTPYFNAGEFDIRYLARDRIIEELYVSRLRRSGYDYLVLSSLFYDRYFTQPFAEPALRQRLREVFEQVPVIKEIAPKFGTYGFNNPGLTLFSLKQQDFARLDEERAAKARGEISHTSNEMRASMRWK